MRLAVMSTVILDVPEDGAIGAIRDRFYDAHAAVIGTPMETRTGQRYVLRQIDRLEIVLVPERGED